MAARRVSPRLVRTLDVVLVGLAALVLALAVSGGWKLHVLGTTIRMRTLDNPMMAFTCVAILRMAWQYRIAIDTSIEAKQLPARRTSATSPHGRSSFKPRTARR